MAAPARYQAYRTCSSEGSSAQKSIFDVSCSENPAMNTRAAVIAFGSSSSDVAIV